MVVGNIPAHLSPKLLEDEDKDEATTPRSKLKHVEDRLKKRIRRLEIENTEKSEAIRQLQAENKQLKAASEKTTSGKGWLSVNERMIGNTIFQLVKEGHNTGKFKTKVPQDGCVDDKWYKEWTVL